MVQIIEEIMVKKINKPVLFHMLAIIGLLMSSLSSSLNTNTYDITDGILNAKCVVAAQHGVTYCEYENGDRCYHVEDTQAVCKFSD